MYPFDYIKTKIMYVSMLTQHLQIVLPRLCEKDIATGSKTIRLYTLLQWQGGIYSKYVLQPKM